MKIIEMISLPKLYTAFTKIPWLKILMHFLLVVFTGFAGLVIAYLIASGNWLYAAVLLVIVPGLLILFKNPFFGVLIWLLLIPFLLHTQTSSSRQVYWIVHRLLPVLSLLLLVISSAFGPERRSLPKLTIVEYSMGAYIILTIISILSLNIDPLATLYRFYDLLFIPMCLYMVIRLCVPNKKSMQLLVPVAVFITTTQVAIGILSWIAPSVLPSAWMKLEGVRTTGSLSSVGVYTTTLFLTGMILLNAGLLSNKKWKRYLFAFLFLSTIYVTILSLSRASWLAGIIIFPCLIFLYPKFMGRLVLVFGAATIVFGLLFHQSSFYKTLSNRLVSEESESSALSRLPVYVAAIRMFNDKPLFGWGYDNFDRFDRTYQVRFGDIVNPAEKDLTSHSVYLTILAEQGLVGLSLYLIPYIVLFWRSRSTVLNTPKYGVLNKRMFVSLWLVLLGFFVVQNLAPMSVVFGLGVNWITLGFIANYVHLYS